MSTSKVKRWSRAQASSPSHAATHSCPRRSTAAFSTRRQVGSSSATSTRISAPLHHGAERLEDAVELDLDAPEHRRTASKRRTSSMGLELPAQLPEARRADVVARALERMGAALDCVRVAFRECRGEAVELGAGVARVLVGKQRQELAVATVELSERCEARALQHGPVSVGSVPLGRWATRLVRTRG